LEIKRRSLGAFQWRGRSKRERALVTPGKGMVEMIIGGNKGEI
jgi:hypothetical protein